MMKMRILFIGLIISHVACFGQERPDAQKKRIWGAAYHISVEGDNNPTRLEGLDVSQGPEHLMGGFFLVRQMEKSQLELKGHFNKLGEFTPNVSLEVSDRRDGGWKTVESTLSDRSEATLITAPHIDQLPLSIQLDAVQPYVGKFKFWRVTLQTGESQVFPMVWLTEKGE